MSNNVNGYDPEIAKYTVADDSTETDYLLKVLKEEDETDSELDDEEGDNGTGEHTDIIGCDDDKKKHIATEQIGDLEFDVSIVDPRIVANEIGGYSGFNIQTSLQQSDIFFTGKMYEARGYDDITLYETTNKHVYVFQDCLQRTIIKFLNPWSMCYGVYGICIAILSSIACLFLLSVSFVKKIIFAIMPIILYFMFVLYNKKYGKLYMFIADKVFHQNKQENDQLLEDMIEVQLDKKTDKHTLSNVSLQKIDRWISKVDVNFGIRNIKSLHTCSSQLNKYIETLCNAFQSANSTAALSNLICDQSCTIDTTKRLYQVGFEKLKDSDLQNPDSQDAKQLRIYVLAHAIQTLEQKISRTPSVDFVNPEYKMNYQTYYQLLQLHNEMLAIEAEVLAMKRMMEQDLLKLTPGSALYNQTDQMYNKLSAFLNHLRSGLSREMYNLHGVKDGINAVSPVDAQLNLFLILNNRMRFFNNMPIL